MRYNLTILWQGTSAIRILQTCCFAVKEAANGKDLAMSFQHFNVAIE